MRQHLACGGRRHHGCLFGGEGYHAASFAWRARLHASHIVGETAPFVARSISIWDERAGNLFPRDQ
jgi:hypothetical protein